MPGTTVNHQLQYTFVIQTQQCQMHCQRYNEVAIFTHNTCSLFSLGTISVQSRQRSSFCKNASNCSRNFGLWTPFGMNSLVCLTTPGLRSGLLGPNACAGHISNVPALVSIWGCKTPDGGRVYLSAPFADVIE